MTGPEQAPHVGRVAAQHLLEVARGRVGAHEARDPVGRARRQRPGAVVGALQFQVHKTRIAPIVSNTLTPGSRHTCVPALWRPSGGHTSNSNSDTFGLIGLYQISYYVVIHCQFGYCFILEPVQ